MEGPRAILGNNRMAVVLDERANILHLYYPYVGMWQNMHTSRTGIFHARAFSWTNSDDVEVSQEHLESNHSVETHFKFRSATLNFLDAVHPQLNVFIRRVRLDAKSGEVLKVFFYNRLNICEFEQGETVFYDDDTKSLVHFKNGTFFMFGSSPAFSSHACGEHTVRGLSGTYVDAEDGELRRNDVSQGLVDSTFEVTLRPDDAGSEAYVYIIAGRSLSEVTDTWNYLMNKGLAKTMHETLSFWSSWISHKPVPDSGLPDSVKRVFKLSLYTLENSVDRNGAIVASLDSRTAKTSGNSYNYCWWRDASYVTYALNLVGLSNLSLEFLRFAHRYQLPDGSFYHRVRPDGSWGSTWHRKPFIQLDQTASIISAVYDYYLKTRDVENLLELWPMVRSAAFYIASKVQDGLPIPSYDLWEEEHSVHVYTAGAVWHGLVAAELIGDVLGKERRGWLDVAKLVRRKTLERFTHSITRRLDTEDGRADSASLMLVNTGFVEGGDPIARRIVDQVETKLLKPGGGVARYEGDAYYGHENPWVISTLWLAQAKMILGDFETAKRHIEWAASCASSTGLLPEQVDHAKRNTSVIPLTWSHATYVNTVTMLVTGLREGTYRH
jgi:GH15 family glucan-1,4-alpha-glucosidase